MGKYSKEDYEFEKSKQAILELTKHKGVKQQEKHTPVWAYELEEYRRKKKLDKFLIFGAVCGLISLVMSSILLLNEIYKFLG